MTTPALTGAQSGAKAALLKAMEKPEQQRQTQLKSSRQRKMPGTLRAPPPEPRPSLMRRASTRAKQAINNLQERFVPDVNKQAGPQLILQSFRPVPDPIHTRIEDIVNRRLANSLLPLGEAQRQVQADPWTHAHAGPLLEHAHEASNRPAASSSQQAEEQSESVDGSMQVHPGTPPDSPAMGLKPAPRARRSREKQPAIPAFADFVKRNAPIRQTELHKPEAREVVDGWCMHNPEQVKAGFRPPRFYDKENAG